MQGLLRSLSWQVSETRDASTIAFGRQITPLSRVIQVRWSGGAHIWRSPMAIEIRQGGIVRRRPIHDVTQWINSGLIITGLAIVTMTSLWFKMKNKAKE